MLDFYVLRLRKTRDNGDLINGKWRRQKWVDGETIFPSYRDAEKVRRSIGGDILPFKESRLFDMLTDEVKEAFRQVENISMNSFEGSDEDLDSVLDQRIDELKQDSEVEAEEFDPEKHGDLITEENFDNIVVND